jgi:hypothetical protein
VRIPRKPWMRKVPKSKFYECRICGYSYLLVFGKFIIRRSLAWAYR